MTKEFRNPNAKWGCTVPSSLLRISNIRASFVVRASSFFPLPEQLGDADVERREQLFGERFLAGQNTLQHQSILAPVINLNVVVTRIDNVEIYHGSQYGLM